MGNELPNETLKSLADAMDNLGYCILSVEFELVQKSDNRASNDGRIRLVIAPVVKASE